MSAFLPPGHTPSFHANRALRRTRDPLYFFQALHELCFPPCFTHASSFFSPSRSLLLDSARATPPHLSYVPFWRFFPWTIGPAIALHQPLETVAFRAISCTSCFICSGRPRFLVAFIHTSHTFFPRAHVQLPPTSPFFWLCHTNSTGIKRDVDCPSKILIHTLCPPALVPLQRLSLNGLIHILPDLRSILWFLSNSE